MNQFYPLPPEPMTEEGFTPYGWLMHAPEPPPQAGGMFPVGFECDGRTTINTIWQPSGERVFTQLERHFGVTQAFVQLSGPPSVVCVACATDIDDPFAIPSPEDVRAFLIDPAKGYCLARGTWHSLDRYVLEPPGAVFVILNVDPNPSQIVDYATGVSLLYDDLAADACPRETELDGDFGASFELMEAR